MRFALPAIVLIFFLTLRVIRLVLWELFKLIQQIVNFVMYIVLRASLLMTTVQGVN